MFNGDRLKELRLSKDITQQQLSDLLSNEYHLTLSRATISQYENGSRTPDVYALVAFTKIFNCSSDYLLGLDDHINFSEKFKSTVSDFLAFKI